MRTKTIPTEEEARNMLLKARVRRSHWHSWVKNWELYLFLLIPLAYILIFKYGSMGGLIIVFKDYKIRKGIWGSDWVGFQNFARFFESYEFRRVLINTVKLSFYTLIAGFPIPILFALVLNCMKGKRLAKVAQTIAAMPHFISTVVIVGLVFTIFHNKEGIYGHLVHNLTEKWPSDLFAEPKNFMHFYVWSGVWQGFGWGSILYTAALTGVDPSYHEAAMLDGASRIQRVIHVDIPAILPTIVTMLILRMGSVMTIGFEKVYMLQNSLNISASQVISTYTYEVGLASGAGDYSYAAAVGMFNNVVELILVLIVNKISNKLTETSLW